MLVNASHFPTNLSWLGELASPSPLRPQAWKELLAKHERVLSLVHGIEVGVSLGFEDGRTSRIAPDRPLPPDQIMTVQQDIVAEVAEGRILGPLPRCGGDVSISPYLTCFAGSQEGWRVPSRA